MHDTSPATLMVVDDHPLLRKGLTQLIAMEDQLLVVGEASSGKEAIELALKLEPDLITLDLNMHGIDGLETLKSMRDLGVLSRIIILTVSDHEKHVVDAIRLGADGYLLKDMEPEDLIIKLKEAVLGKLVMSPQLAEVLAVTLRRTPSNNERQLDSLTARELDIIQLLAKGWSNKLIARALDISDATVKVHVKHLLKKLGLRSRVEAAVWMVNQQR